VLSRAGSREINDSDYQRAVKAMDAVYERLVHFNERLLCLLAPPFDKTTRDPGYINGYPPGIRENGGQYTHAALWTVWAFSELGQGKRAQELFKLLNPIYHSDTPEKADQYRVEPYVVAADVYNTPSQTRQGGWTWYTGSGGWMYRLGVEGILGLRRQGKALQFKPSIPGEWQSFQITYRYGDSYYQVRVENPDGVETGVRKVILDGDDLVDLIVPLDDDGQEHEVRVVMGK
jgi:cyclic beta-1,2-glucan synthetase